MGVLVLLEQDRVRDAVDRDAGVEGMRLGNLVDRLQESPAIGEGKPLPRAVRPHGFDRNGGRFQCGSGFGLKPESRRCAILDDVEDDRAAAGFDPLRLVMVMRGMRRSMTVAMAMAMAGMRAAARTATRSRH